MQADINQKTGQLFFVSIEGYTLMPKTKEFLKKLQPGGVILFENNIKDKNQLKKLIKDINSCIKIRPFITCDQEGGHVERLRKVSTSVPSLWGSAKTGEKNLLKAQEIIASEMKWFGFNMTLSPVLDINSNKKNPIINTRAISSDPKIVSKLGSSLAKLYLKNKLIPVGKHFPGHGDLNIDSHLNMPVLNKSKNELLKFELVPFKNVIKNNIPALMVSHIQLPRIEKNKQIPATLSKNIIQNLLKKELKYKGLIISDDMTMKGITKSHSLPMATKKAILAGINMVLLNTKDNNIENIFNCLNDECRINKNLERSINESYEKILKIKQKYLRRDVPLGRLYNINWTNNFKQSHEITSQVVHWVKKDLFFTPLKKDFEVIYPITPKLLKEDLKKILKTLKMKNVKLFSYNLNPNSKGTKYLLKHLDKRKKKVIITFNPLCFPNQKSFVNKILAIYPDTVLISTGLDYDIGVAPKAKNHIDAYGPNYISLLCAFEKVQIP